MYYCLTSKRDIGDYTQAISSYQKGSPSLSRSLHENIRTLLATLDGNHDNGTTKWVSANELNDLITTDNPATNPAYTGSVTFYSPSNTDFETVSVRVYNVEPSNFITAVSTEFTALTGLSLSTQSVKDKFYITDCVIRIHLKESANDEQS